MEMKTILPIVGMLIAQIVQVGQMVFGKKAMLYGMSSYTFTCYANAISSLILLPCCFLFETSKYHCQFTFQVFYQCIMYGILSGLVQIFAYTGIQYASPALVSSMLNLVPGFTFMLAIILRMEKIDCKSARTHAKFIGTAVSILGAFLVTLYRGPQIIKSYSYSTSSDLSDQSRNWVIGGLFMALDCVLFAFLFIAQALILAKYPAKLIVTLFATSVTAILSATLSLVVEKDLSFWSLESKERILAVVCGGVFGAVFLVIGAWCMESRGPIFVSMFNPMGIVVATVLGVSLLGDSLYLGSLVGSIVIFIGFYSVLWGNSKDMKDGEVNDEDNKSPLLQNEEDETV